MAGSDSTSPVEYRVIPGGKKRIYRLGTDGSAWSSKDGGASWFRMTPGKFKSGHRVIYLGRENFHYLHRLMMETFVGPPPSPGMYVCHINDDPSDNRIENLRYGTAQDNADDAARNGRSAKGVKAGRVKLTEAQVLDVVRMAKEGAKQKEIARIIGTTHVNVQAILYGLSWSHLTGIEQRRYRYPKKVTA